MTRFFHFETKMIPSELSQNSNLGMSNFIRGIINSDFIRNVLIFMGGALLGQVVTMATAPIITRLYTPENFGFKVEKSSHFVA